MTTEMTEKGLEDLIVAAMTGETSPAGAGGEIRGRPGVFTDLQATAALMEGR